MDKERRPRIADSDVPITMLMLPLLEKWFFVREGSYLNVVRLDDDSVRVKQRINGRGHTVLLARRRLRER